MLSPKIITQSSYILSRSQLSLLNRRPNFTTTTKFNHLIFKDDSKKYSQGVCKLNKYLMAEENSLVRNPLTKLVRTNNSDLQQLITEMKHVDSNYQIFTDKLTKGNKESITKLTENENIILKKSDKGG